MVVQSLALTGQSRLASASVQQDTVPAVGFAGVMQQHIRLHSSVCSCRKLRPILVEPG